MTVESTYNGASRYLSVSSVAGNTRRHIDIPPLGKEFIGDLSIAVDVFPSGRVDFYLIQPTKVTQRGLIIDDIHKVIVPSRSEPKVQRYPKPHSLTETWGPGAPLIWKSDKPVPAELIEVLRASVTDLVNSPRYGHTNVKGVQEKITSALSRLGIAPVAQNQSRNNESMVVVGL